MRAMLAVVFSIAVAVLSWGSYIPVLHKGQAAMDGSRLRPFICVGLAYFVIAVIVPAVTLLTRGEKGSWSRKGLIYSFAGGTFGALGALGVILAQNSGGDPLFVIPLIFGCAPVVNTFVTMFINKSYKEVGPAFLAGLILVIGGAVTVLIFKPVGPERAGAGFLTVLTSSLQALIWVACTALCWGIYGPILHKGQAAMAGSRMRPFLCVGLAYMVIAVVIPFVLLGTETQGGWDWPAGIGYSLAGGAAGALGALGIIMAFNFGGKPVYVMPLVFGGAPVVGTIISLALAGGSVTPSPAFYAGLIAVAVGAVTVLVFAPKPHLHPAPAKRKAAVASV